MIAAVGTNAQIVGLLRGRIAVLRRAAELTELRATARGILVALVSYIIYLNLLALGRAWLADGSLPDWLGLWWVHLAALGAALWLLWRGERLPRPRGVAAAVEPPPSGSPSSSPMPSSPTPPPAARVSVRSRRGRNRK